MAYYADSGVLNGAFVIIGNSVQHVIERNWRAGKFQVQDQSLTNQLNRILRSFSIDQLRAMSGNPAINSAVYSMNVWYSN